MKRYEYINLNGKNFKLDTKDYYEHVPTIPHEHVTDVYGRCSDMKKAIFNSWFDWFVSHGGYCGVSSHNCNFFTISGIVEDEATGKTYFCYITHANNNCIEIKEA